MICSRCSEIVKPVVAVDIDGTLGDYHGALVEFASKYLGHPIRPMVFEQIYGGHYPLRAWFCSEFDISVETFRAIKLAYRQGANKRFMPIFTGAQALCWSIRDAGAELWVTTTRPFLSLDNIVPDTVEWLRRHEIEYDGMLFDDDKYRILAERVDPRRVVAVFDDLEEMVDAANVHFPGRGWLVRGQWNSGVRSPLSCDLDSAADLARNAIMTWRSIHEC